MDQTLAGTIIRSTEDADRVMAQVRSSAAHLHNWVAAQTDPLEMLQRIKFSPVGFHPINEEPISLAEQVDQTWIYAVAVAAARQLLMLHPQAGGFQLAPGANNPCEVNVTSESDGLVCAETFTAAIPRNHRKLKQEIFTLAARANTYRYVFFFSPAFPGNARQPQLDRCGVQVWSVDV